MKTTTHAAKAETARSARFNFRATEEDAALVRQAAFARRQSVTEFMLQAALDEARVALQEAARVEVGAELYDRLAAELGETEPSAVLEAVMHMIKADRKLELPD